MTSVLITPMEVFGKRTRVSASKGNGTGVGIAGDEYADGSDVFAKPHKNF